MRPLMTKVLCAHIFVERVCDVLIDKLLIWLPVYDQLPHRFIIEIPHSRYFHVQPFYFLWRLKLCTFGNPTIAKFDLPAYSKQCAWIRIARHKFLCIQWDCRTRCHSYFPCSYSTYTLLYDAQFILSLNCKLTYIVSVRRICESVS